MRITQASHKIETAIDALIDLQQDYTDEVMAAKIGYDLQITIDTLNRLNTEITSIR